MSNTTKPALPEPTTVAEAFAAIDAIEPEGNMLTGAQRSNLGERRAKAMLDFIRVATPQGVRAHAAACEAAAMERCAKLCDKYHAKWMEIARHCGGDDGNEISRAYMAEELADAIRALKTQEQGS